MKITKKYFVILLAVLCILAFAACADKDGDVPASDAFKTAMNSVSSCEIVTTVKAESGLTATAVETVTYADGKVNVATKRTTPNQVGAETQYSVTTTNKEYTAEEYVSLVAKIAEASSKGTLDANGALVLTLTKEEMASVLGTSGTNGATVTVKLNEAGGFASAIASYTGENGNAVTVTVTPR